VDGDSIVDRLGDSCRFEGDVDCHSQTVEDYGFNGGDGILGASGHGGEDSSFEGCEGVYSGLFERTVECALFTFGQDGGGVDYQVHHREESILALAVMDDPRSPPHP